jgi:hypothetical protein
MVQRFVSLVIDCSASLNCTASVIRLFGPAARHDETAPDASTGRLWILRIGLAALLRPKVIADDWIWLIDHSIQIGQSKCLVILGIRLRDFVIARPLAHQDMELIALVPMKKATKHTVAKCLLNAVAETGVPRAILSDHGADLHGAITIFRRQHSKTVELYDIKHKAACLLKALLEGDEQWKRFASLSGQTKFATQQTELAFLVPPSQRSKSRFMNLGELMNWGRQTLALLDEPSRLQRLGASMEHVRSKLGWLTEFREVLAEWSAYQDVIEKTWEFVRCRGYYARAGEDLAAAVPTPSRDTANELRQKLIAFVTAESSKARSGEILPGTTEVLESCFGKLKALESGQSKSGFTGLVLSLGAMVSDWTAESIGEALRQCRVRDVLDWCRKMLGRSVQSQRQEAYGGLDGATKPG